MEDAQGDIVPQTQGGITRAPFTLFVNEVEKGVAVVSLKSDDVLVLAADLAAAGLDLPKDRIHDVDGEPMISLQSLSPPLKYSVDERTITLRITAPVSFLPQTNLDLAMVPPHFERSTDTSMFWNYSLRVIDLLDVEAYQEVGVNSSGNLMFSSMYMSSLLGPRRGITNYTINDPESLRRFVLGDALVSTGPLGGGAFVGGFTFSRSYELNPYAVKAPRIGFQGSTLTPATVDVYVNGVRVRSEDVQPGTFQLNNLRVGGGKGAAVYIIRDVFGQEQRIELPFYISSSVLAKGRDEFTYSLGFLRQDLSTSSWGYNRPAGIARHRYGFNDSLTVGYRAEVGNDAVSGGPVATTLTPLGQFEVELAGSAATNTGQAGYASFASYGYQTKTMGGGLFGTLTSDHYANIALHAQDDRLTRDAGLYLSTPLKTYGSVAANAHISRFRDQGTGWNVGGQVSGAITRQIYGLLWGAYQVLADGEASWEIQLTVNLFFGMHNVSLGGSISDRTKGGNISASKPNPLGPGYGYRAFAQFTDQQYTAEGRVQYQGTAGRYAVGYGDLNGQSHAAVEVAGALALVPGVGVFPTLPVQDAFGVIRVPGVKGVTGMVNNLKIGKTDRHGNLVVPNLLSYYGNRLGIVTDDLPIEYQVEKTEMILAPSQRGAAVATFIATKPHFYRGTVVLTDHGKRIIPKYGELRVTLAASEVTSPIGENGEFELADVTAGSHTAMVSFEERMCEFDFVARDATDTIIEVGELTCSRITRGTGP